MRASSFLAIFIVFYIIFIYATSTSKSHQIHPLIANVPSQEHHPNPIILQNICPLLTTSTNCHLPSLTLLRPIISPTTTTEAIPETCLQLGTLYQFSIGTIIHTGAPKLSHLYNKYSQSIPICVANNQPKTTSEEQQQKNQRDHTMISFVVQSLTQHVERGFFLDIGIGNDAGKASLTAAVLGYRVIAFESSYERASMLSSTFQMNKITHHGTIFNNLVSDRVERNTQEKGIPGICLSTLVPYLNVVSKAENLPKIIVLLKITAKDLEPLVLRGASLLFDEYQVKTIIVVLRRTTWKSCLPMDVVTALIEQGYVMSTQDGKRLIENKEEFRRWWSETTTEIVDVVFEKK